MTWMEWLIALAPVVLVYYFAWHRPRQQYFRWKQADEAARLEPRAWRAEREQVMENYHASAAEPYDRNRHNAAVLEAQDWIIVHPEPRAGADL
jgi:hypothetical protein